MHSEALETIELAGYTASLYRDESPESPRAWDNLGTMACFHRRYNLGDPPEMEIEEIEAGLESGELIGLPLYLYDHGGITMRTGPFSDPWDSGRVGYIYVHKTDALKEWGRKRLSPYLRRKVLEVLNGEVQVYDEFITGQVYGYVVTGPDGEHRDSCWGFFGLEYAIDEARRVLTYEVQRSEKAPAAA